MIEIEVQNETHQTQFHMKAVVVPRIGEGIRLQEPNGAWASYDVMDVWYQKAEYGDIWVPYLHVRMTPGDCSAIMDPLAAAQTSQAQAMPIEDFLAKFEGEREHEPTRIKLDLGEDA